VNEGWGAVVPALFLCPNAPMSFREDLSTKQFLNIGNLPLARSKRKTFREMRRVLLSAKMAAVDTGEVLIRESE
jgi:hypothetical protein